MKAFAYSKQTGEIIYVFNGSFSLADQIETDAIGYINATNFEGDPDAHYIENGSIKYRGDRPTFDHKWNGATWELDVAMQTTRLTYKVRKERDERLAASDWVVAKYTELGTGIPAQWTAYRQALRDIPQQPGFPVEVQWPNEPV
jgi:hypothetical protein